MLQLLGAYLAVAGGVSAGAQVARVAVRGAGRLARGDTRGALAEVAGGLTAPVVSAVHQLSRLGAEVCQSATALTAEARHQFAAGRSAEQPGSARRRRPAAAESNAIGAAAEGAAG
jgi:hypothetical protein